MSPNDKPSWQDALKAMLPADYQSSPEMQDELQVAPAPKPLLTVTLDRKRAGKIATIISGFSPEDPAAQQLATTLKKKLAVGGSARGGEILLQGDRVAQVLELLKNSGYKAKRN